MRAGIDSPAFGSIVCASLGCALLTLAPWIESRARSVRERSRRQDPDVAKVQDAFRAQGIQLDLERGLCSIRCTVDIRDDLLEYLVVNYHGAAHESLFASEVVGSQLNAALLALGAEPGRNARWLRKEPPPSDAEMRAGALPYDVKPPDGDGFYLYVGWRIDGETYFYRAEDLLRNLATGRGMQRQRWVFLGSRMVRARGSDTEQAFAADLEGNLVNIAFFEQGNTLITCALPECLSQSIWLPNAWLLPARGSAVDFIFSRQRLASPPADLEARLPVLERESDGDDGR